MATTIPRSFPYDPSVTITAEKHAIIVEWYESALRDSDKAAAGFDEGYYTGQVEMCLGVLLILAGLPIDTDTDALPDKPGYDTPRGITHREGY